MNLFRRNKSSSSEAKDGETEEQEQRLSTSMNETPPLAGASAATGSTIKEKVSSVLPKVEKLPWSTFLCLSLWCAVPAVTYIVLFTVMGFGEYFYYGLSHQFGDYADALIAGLILSGFFFYIFDMDEWNSRIGNIIHILCLAVLFAVLVLIVILASNEVPFGIIALYALLNPIFLLGVGAIFYREKDTRTFFSWLSGPLILISLLTVSSFIAWVCADYHNRWHKVTRVVAAEHTGCEPNFEDYPTCVSQDGTDGTCFYVDDSNERQQLVFPEGCDQMCLNVYSQCSNGFILWAGPVMLSLSALFLGFFCTFLRTEGTMNEKDIFNFGKAWSFLVFIMWASASISGAAAGVTTALTSLTLANLIGATIIFRVVFSKEERDQSQEAVLKRLHDKYGDENLNIVRGLFIASCSPILLGYFFLSVINQLVRRIGINPCAQPTRDVSDPDKNSGIVTVRAKKQLTMMRSWDRAKVFTYAIYCGVAYMIMQVLVAKMTVVFLSWMIEQTAGIGIVTVTLIMAGVGVLMFLLPPVPGVPVYLTLGIILSAQGYEILGWAGSILYSTGVSLVLKLFSSALQQKMIGENLSHSVKVKQFVGMNSTLMKAMRLVLGQGGLSVPKVAILVGGPDWPTSVLCGIMRLSLLQIMLGTLPVVFLIFPTCLTGALLYMASLQTATGNPMFPWSRSVSTLTASATTIVQLGAAIVAAHYLEQATDKRAEEVKAIEDDEEVREADQKDEHLRKCYETVTQWNVLPIWLKSILIWAVAFITIACYMVQFFSHLCFVEHSLTDSIYENLGGHVGNLFLPLGWAAIALFGASILLLSIFSLWGKRQAKAIAASGKTMYNFPGADNTATRELEPLS